MATDYLSGTQLMRDKAWAEVLQSETYKAFVALDAAVVAMGGQSMDKAAPSAAAITSAHCVGWPPVMPVVRERIRRQPSHADMAWTALRKSGRPLSIGRFLEATIAEGAEIGGDQLANFRSTLSKDNRFQSVRHNSMYFWWFADEPLPLEFRNETQSAKLAGLLD
ncbi:MAG: hypothetical protein EOP62_21895 [Sphingomonadales bacterium]|nr:MAG: hypothetical protein EOP62_21895 [Sphingomonadales bacterium]